MIAHTTDEVKEGKIIKLGVNGNSEEIDENGNSRRSVI